MEPRPTSARGLDGLAFAALYAQLAAVFWVVPEWSLARFRDPVYLAVAAGIATTFLITWLRARGRVGSNAERVTAADGSLGCGSGTGPPRLCATVSRR